MSIISVVMTTYNGEKFVLKQLESLLYQSLPADEVIICDDRSSDSTVNIIKKYIEENHLEHWQLFENETNLGYIANFRNGMSKAHGDIIFLCDQDDIWHKDKIRNMSDIMENDNSISALACGYNLIDSEDKPFESHEKKFYTPKNNKRLSRVNYGSTLYYNIAQGCAQAYRRTCVATYLESSPHFILPHDWALNIIAYENKGLFFLNEELLSYRIHSNNTTGIADSGNSYSERIPRLKKYASFMADVSKLKIHEETKNKYLKLSEYTEDRINFLKNKKISIWFSCMFKNLSLEIKPFFLPFLKDLALVIFKKTP